MHLPSSLGHPPRARAQHQTSRALPECRSEIIFLFDRVAPEKIFTSSRHPRDRADFPLVGIFAQRAKDRPNRIGVTTCKDEKAKSNARTCMIISGIMSVIIVIGNIIRFAQEGMPR